MVKQWDNIFCIQQSVAQQQFEAAQILYQTLSRESSCDTNQFFFTDDRMYQEVGKNPNHTLPHLPKHSLHPVMGVRHHLKVPLKHMFYVVTEIMTKVSEHRIIMFQFLSLCFSFHHLQNTPSSPLTWKGQVYCLQLHEQTQQASPFCETITFNDFLTKKKKNKTKNPSKSGTLVSMVNLLKTEYIHTHKHSPIHKPKCFFKCHLLSQDIRKVS